MAGLPEPISREGIEDLILARRQKNPADRLEIRRIRLVLLRQLDDLPARVRVGENPQPKSGMLEVLVLEALRVRFDCVPPVRLRRNEESPLVFDSGVLRFLEVQMLSSRCFFKIFFPRGVILYPCFELRGLSGRVISMLSSSRAGSR